MKEIARGIPGEDEAHQVVDWLRRGKTPNQKVGTVHGIEERIKTLDLPMVLQEDKKEIPPHT